MDLFPLGGAIGWFGVEIGSSAATLIYRLQRRHQPDRDVPLLVLPRSYTAWCCQKNAN